MASPINAPLHFKFVAVAGNSGTEWDAAYISSIVNWRADFQSAATPVYNAYMANANFKQLRWIIYVTDVGYSTPTNLYPYHKAHKVVLSGATGKTEYPAGNMQAWATHMVGRFQAAERLATPVI